MRFLKIALFAAVTFTFTMSIPALGIESDPANPTVGGKPANAKFPFIAEVTGNDVYVRSNKGKAYYHCMKVNAGFQVTVVDEVYGWAKILPPEGSYSWIHKNYVDVKEDAPTVGTVSGDNVRVWAGSDYMGPTRSSSMQVKINTGEQVELFAAQPETGDYYKIKPPTGAHLWIYADFLKFAGKGVEETMDVPAEPNKAVEEIVKEPLPLPTEDKKPTFQNLEDIKEATPAVPVEEKTVEVVEDKPEPTPVVIPKKTDKETQTLAQCYDISAKVDEELKKPLNEQDYSVYKKSLENIAKEKENGKAATYAKILVERIERYELAISVTDLLNQQDKDLAATKKQIQKAHQSQLKKIPAGAKYMYTGTLKQSHVYTEKNGQKRYMLLDSNGKILCYLISASGVTEAQLAKMVNAKVGINGTLVTGTKSLVGVIAVTAVDSVK